MHAASSMTDSELDNWCRSRSTFSEERGRADSWYPIQFDLDVFILSRQSQSSTQRQVIPQLKDRSAAIQRTTRHPAATGMEIWSRITT